MPGLVSRYQNAFISGRLVSDNLIFHQELIGKLQRFKSKFLGLSAFFSKAFDRISWTSLEEMQTPNSFYSTYHALCIHSILVNGCATKSFCGLRQGDPVLSPFLFVLCTEALSRNLQMAERQGKTDFTISDFGIESMVRKDIGLCRKEGHTLLPYILILVGLLGKWFVLHGLFGSISDVR